MCQKISQIWSQCFLLLFLCALCFRDSCLALRPLLLWNWRVGGNTLIATLCRVAEMYLTSTHFCTHAHIFIETQARRLLTIPNVSFSSLQCVLATYGIFAVTAAAYLILRQKKKENQTSTSTAWEANVLQSCLFSVMWGVLHLQVSCKLQSVNKCFVCACLIIIHWYNEQSVCCCRNCNKIRNFLIRLLPLKQHVFLYKRYKIRRMAAHFLQFDSWMHSRSWLCF